MDTVLKNLLPKLRCPAEQTPLREATPAELEQLNSRIKAGKMTNVGGESVSEALDAALVREAGDLAYPIRREIPILIIEEGMQLSS